MKSLKFLVIAFFVLAGCSDDFIEEPLPEMTDEDLKCGRLEKTITLIHFARLSAETDFSIPPVPCVPEQAGVVLGGGGWISGYANFLGKVNRDESTFVRESCFLGPGPTQVTTISTGQMVGMRGDKYFYTTEYVADMATMTFEGTVTIDGGTGIFEDATGEVKMVDGVFDSVGNASWRGIGKITLVRKTRRHRYHL